MKKLIVRSTTILAALAAPLLVAKTYTAEQTAAESKRANEFFDKLFR
jgi:hypothetical protein